MFINKKKQLYIFGDSFAASYAEDRKNKNYFLDGKKFDSYVKSLEKVYKIVNYADKGLSCFDVVENILKAIKRDQKLEDSYCLVILPDPDRFNYKVKDRIIDTELTKINFSSSKKLKQLVIDRYGEDLARTLIQFSEYNNNKRTMYFYHLTSIINLTKVFKNTLIWDINIHYHYLFDEQKKRIINDSVSDNQIFCNYPLERFYQEGPYPNHFDKPMHRNMTKIITKWITENELDLSCFPPSNEVL